MGNAEQLSDNVDMFPFDTAGNVLLGKAARRLHVVRTVHAIWLSACSLRL